MSSLFAKSTLRTRGKDEVYVATVPLRARKGAAQLLMSAACSLNLWDLQHFMVVEAEFLSKVMPFIVFDFQPRDPENIYTALALLSGRAVPGAALVRNLAKLPRSRCSFVGYSEVDASNVATEFNDRWETNLRVDHHDCRDYTNGLVEILTGEKHVLEGLRSTDSKG